MDDETRFWLASEIADTKYVSDIRRLLADGREIAGKKSLTFITDGAFNYAEAFRKEYRTLKGPRSVHIPHIPIRRRS